MGFNQNKLVASQLYRLGRQISLTLRPAKQRPTNGLSSWALGFASKSWLPKPQAFMAGVTIFTGLTGKVIQPPEFEIGLALKRLH